MSLEKLERMLGSNQLKFPMPDMVVAKLTMLINDENSTMEDIADVVQTNPVLAGRILQMANSAALRARSRTVSVEDAIKRLGLMFVRDVSLALTLKSLFKGDNKKLTDVWDFSLKIASRMLVLSSHFNNSSNTSMLTGLMSQIGELPILAYSSEHGELEYTKSDVKRLSARIVRDWKLPDEIHSAINGTNNYGKMLQFVEAYLKGEVGRTSLDISFQDFEQMEVQYADVINQFESMMD